MTTYYNSTGLAMPVSATPQTSINGTSAGGETLQAANVASAVNGGGGGDTLVGSSAADTTFYLSDPADVVQAKAGVVNTEAGFVSITAAENVQNITVNGDFHHAVGNSLDNLIIGDARQWLYGAGGNDVLVGAFNAQNTFVVAAGEGNDVIYNWEAGDQLQLRGFSFHSAADIRAAMTQQGSDIVLQLSPSQTLTFRGVSLAANQFPDKALLLPLDTSKFGALTFQDEFNSLSTYDPSHQTGLWNTDFGSNPKDHSAYSLWQNGEQELYTHEGFEGLGEQNLHINPFSISNGVLTITAEPIPQEQQAAAFGHKWSSGMLNTLNLFEQKYGYFEVRAQLPAAEGAWPAFWMVPAPYQPNQEGDIFEALGSMPGMDYRRAYGADGTIFENALKIDPSAWHTYGMLWTKDHLSFYIDGYEVAGGATPATWTNPMGMILNMAVGGWGGNPDPADFPAEMNVDYVRAYALADGSTEVYHETPTAPAATIQDKASQPASVTPAQLTFQDTGAPLSSGKIVVLSHAPAAADIPAQGRAFLVWQDGANIYGAESNSGALDPATQLATGSISKFTGAGTFLTDGRVVLNYTGQDLGQPAAFALVFNPATRTFTQHELGVSNGAATFVPLANGDFAASWHDPSGGVHGRAYSAFAYGGEPAGWWGPVRDLAGDAVGVTDQGELITKTAAGATEVYSVVPNILGVVGHVSLAATSVSHATNPGSTTDFSFKISRDDLSQAGTVAWKVVGVGDHPATASDFVGGVMPTGVATFNINTPSIDIHVQVVDDGAAGEETFQVVLYNPVGTALGNATQIGVIDPGAASGGDTTGGGSGGDTTGGGSGGDTTGGGSGGDTTSGSGQVYTSTQGGSVWTGTSGADTFYASDAGDTLTGGQGGDIFVFGREPITPIHITDFHLGEDKLDLSALFQKAGYTGSDPVADGYVYFDNDGAGGTTVRFDRDGTATGQQWPNTIIDLEHVSRTGLTWAQLSGQAAPGGGDTTGGGSGGDTTGGGSGGDTTGGGSGGDTTSGGGGDTTSGSGHVYTSTQGGSVWTGTAGADTFYASDAGDTLIGGQGGDIFVFGREPIVPIHITDFHLGEDKLDLSALFQKAGYTGTDPVADGYVYFDNDGAGGTTVRFDRDGTATGQQWPNTIIDLEHVSRTGLTWAQLSGQAGPSTGGGDTTGGGAGGDTTGGGSGGDTTSGGSGGDTTSGGGGGDTTSSGSAQVYTSTHGGSAWTGTSGADTFYASDAADTLTGGQGADLFVIGREPIVPIHITDFHVGEDKIDLSALFQKAGYTGTDPIGDGYMYIASDGADGTILRFDRDAGGTTQQWPNTIINLEHVAPGTVTASDWIIH